MAAPLLALIVALTVGPRSPGGPSERRAPRGPRERLRRSARSTLFWSALFVLVLWLLLLFL